MLGKKGSYLITDPTTRLYFTGFESSDGYVVFIDDKKYFIVDSRYFYAAKKAMRTSGFTLVKGSHSEMIAVLDGAGDKKLFVDFAKTSLADAQKLTLCGYELCDCSEEVKEARIKKSEREIKLIKKACAIAERSFKALLPYVKEGVTESELAARLEMNFKLFGAEKPSFDTIVAFGENAAVPHHSTGSTALKKNSVVLIDFGCLYKGYCSDITRTMFFGKPTAEFKRAYKAVNAAFDAAYHGIKDGLCGVECDALARNELKRAGMDKAFTHSLGHGVGVDIHEDPYLSPKGERKILNGYVFTIEPGVYFDGKFGIRTENTVTLTPDGVKSLVSLSRRLKVIKA